MVDIDGPGRLVADLSLVSPDGSLTLYDGEYDEQEIVHLVLPGEAGDWKVVINNR